MTALQEVGFSYNGVSKTMVIITLYEIEFNPEKDIFNKE